MRNFNTDETPCSFLHPKSSPVLAGKRSCNVHNVSKHSDKENLTTVFMTRSANSE